MSVRAMTKVWELELAPSLKYVLLAMADHADHDGNNIYPGIKTLVSKTGYSERTIQGVIKELLAAGFLEIQQEKPGQKTIYRLPMGTPAISAPPQKLHPRNICTPAGIAPPQSTTGTPADSAPLPPQSTTIPPSPPYREEPSINHPINHPLTESLPTSANERFEVFCREYPRRGRADTNISGARKRHLDKFKNLDLAAEIIAGAKRFRLFAVHTQIASTPTVPMMTTWLNEGRWRNEYAILAEAESNRQDGPVQTEPEAGVDYILWCPDGEAAAQYFEPDKSRHFDALDWFSSRGLQPSRKWHRYCEQQKEAA